MSRDAKTTKQTIRTLHLFPWRRYDSPALAAATSNHVLCNVIGGAVAPTQRLLPGVSTWRFFPPRDSALADACRIGLRFDVLSAKLEQEHTGGVHCMQVAFNVPAHAAMLVHELQIVKQLAEVCTSASDVTGEVRLENHPRVSSPKAFLARPQARSCPCCSLLWIRWRLVLSKAAYGCLASALRDGWIDYFGPQHMNNISSKLAKAFALAQKLAARFQGEFCLSPLGHDNFSTQQLPDSYTQWCT